MKRLKVLKFESLSFIECVIGIIAYTIWSDVRARQIRKNSKSVSTPQSENNYRILKKCLSQSSHINVVNTVDEIKSRSLFFLRVKDYNGNLLSIQTIRSSVDTLIRE